ncbi:MAG: TatD DNase family protein [Parcubacteria bacterium C7867-001]|nr:MAG: TatD DNase family protein [Parcubacteria bacterium C7867-001]
MKYFDAHCHIQMHQYDDDRSAVIASMKEAEVGGIIVGVDRESSEKAIALANGVTLFASVGLHPNDTPDEVFDMDAMRALAQSPNVVAIGECGLDYYRPEEPESEKARQKDIFKKHIELAIETGKPLMIHARPSKGTMDAYDDAFDILKPYKDAHQELRGDMHFFVGDAVTAAKFVSIDFTLSYTAVLTFTHDYDETIRSLPLSNILTETDAPYAAPAGNRGKRNDPLAVRDVVKALASIRSEDEEVVRASLLQNARLMFALPNN